MNKYIQTYHTYIYGRQLEDTPRAHLALRDAILLLRGQRKLELLDHL